MKSIAVFASVFALSACAYMTPADFDRSHACTSENDPGLCQKVAPRTLCPEDPESCRQTAKKARKKDDRYDGGYDR